MLKTGRLVLRQWTDEDFEPFAALNSDPEVMCYFLNSLSRENSAEVLNTCRDSIEKDGFGFWALEVREAKEFVGMLGGYLAEDLPCSPCVEMCWHLSQSSWRRGYAKETALECLRFAFEDLGLEKLDYIDAVINNPSEGGMKKIGMQNRNVKFFHPKIKKGHVLEEHVLYAISKTDWEGRA